jgi:hypothetical protein
MAKKRTSVTSEIERLSDKVIDQVEKGLWWNALAAATELVVVCQNGCRAEVERVKNKRSSEARARAADAADAAKGPRRRSKKKKTRSR